MATYKTPDVYVEEISIFPPSVAEVATAIPAFIGYTERALKNGVEQVELIPTKVTSLAEYKETFGGAPPVDVKEVELNADNSVKKTEIESTFYMYDSLRMFFNNGGGKCYIISIGSYDDTPSKTDFLNGLAKLKKQDEPTLILFQDAIKLGDDLYEIQKQALDQCNTLQDRFTVCDLLEDSGWQKGIDDFRDKVGINYMKYGAAYTPYLKTNLTKDVKYSDVKGKLKKSGSAIELKKLTTDNDIISIIETLDLAVADNKIINGEKTDSGSLKKYLDTNSITSLLDGYLDKRLEFKTEVNAALAKASIVAADSNTVRTKFRALFTFIYNAVDGLVDDWAQANNSLSVKSKKLVVNSVCDLISGSLKDTMNTLNSYNEDTKTYIGPSTGTLINKIYNDASYDWTLVSEWGTAFTTVSQSATVYTNGAQTTPKGFIENMRDAEATVYTIMDNVNTSVATILAAAKTFVENNESSLSSQFGLFANILKEVGKELTILPPSGAVVGIYAAVDSNRGVWKAPANVSLNSVSRLTETIDNKEQEDLNVDVVAGKSINAIRAFTGKGILIWGARTLAGNDNEWRYVPVRRFFNMVEESVKKSTYWAVFEPNDANTWIKVKSMIENYLTQKWRDGALAGAKPDEAFFVKVGLGTTMTAQDILEGRMNVEIGMAVVRPAEFIILKFSHKLQES